MAIYMNYNALAVKGDVTAEGYQDWIELDSFNMGVGRGITMEVGQMANRESTRPSLSEVTISKNMDAASGGLFADAVAGDAGCKVEIHIVQTGAKQVEVYAAYTLEDCLISSYSVNAGAGGPPHESLSLSFSQIMKDLSKADKSNKNAASMKVGYDLATAKPL